jgi:mono/diheme cytochrome c family protein
MFRRVVNGLELLAGIGALVFVVLLFANEPGGGAASPGAQVFQANCATCHGANGEGGTGPQLSGGAVLRDFPNVADQIRVVTNGRDGMPSFGGSLSAAQIQAVVTYTRTGLGK